MDEALQHHEEAGTPGDTTEAATLASEPQTLGSEQPAPPQQPPWPGYAPGYPPAYPPAAPAYPPAAYYGYGVTQPGYPPPPAPPAMPPIAPGGHAPRSRGLMASGIGLLVLLILGAGVAVIVAMSNSRSVVVAKPAAQTLATSASVAPVAPPVTKTVTKTTAAPPAAVPTSPAAPAPSGTVSNATEIETMLNAHFQDLVNGDYAAAWADLTGSAAGSAGSESEWINAEKGDALYSFTLAVSPQVTSATTATAQITNFVTRAANSGCKTWTGDWSLVKVQAQWLISEANLNGTLSSCNA